MDIGCNIECCMHFARFFFNFVKWEYAWITFQIELSNCFKYSFLHFFLIPPNAIHVSVYLVKFKVALFRSRKSKQKVLANFLDGFDWILSLEFLNISFALFFFFLNNFAKGTYFEWNCLCMCILIRLNRALGLVNVGWIDAKCFCQLDFAEMIFGGLDPFRKPYSWQRKF